MSKISIVLLAILIVMILTVGFCSARDRNLSGWRISIANIYRIWEPDGSDVTYEYCVGGQRYQNGGMAPIGTTYGDKYMILYNPKNPSQSILNTSTPYFYDDEDVGYTSGEILSKNKLKVYKYKDKHYYYFSFRYSVLGVQYTRYQDFTFCGENNIRIEKGMKFKVKYSIINPQRAVMLFDGANMYLVRDIPCDQQDEITR